MKANDFIYLPLDEQKRIADKMDFEELKNLILEMLDKKRKEYLVKEFIEIEDELSKKI